jgi:hypothetical protein
MIEKRQLQLDQLSAKLEFLEKFDEGNIEYES